MTDAVYLTGLGSFFPGPAISNDGIAARLGITGRRELQVGRKALRQNGIRSRHYALDEDGGPLHTNAEMAARAGRAALGAAGLDPAELDYIAAASSQGDMMAPGIGSAVHGELGGAPAEVASFNSFCASGMMALKSAAANILAGFSERALVCASEFASRFLRESYLRGATPDISTQFLRWMLSDGAGAAVLERSPKMSGLSLRLDWIDLISYADRMPTCMMGGGKTMEDGRWLPWSSMPSLQDAVRQGAFHLRQDLKLLNQIVPLGMARYFDLIEAGRIDPDKIDWALYHFSSDIFRQRMVDFAGKTGIPINENRMFTNLYDRGNVGSASIFVMLDELVASGRARPGQRILCMVPESGRFIFGFMMLTVVGEGAKGRDDEPDVACGVEEQAKGHASPLHGRLRRRLTRVWANFERDLQAVPLIRKLNQGTFTQQDYRALLLNLRQQVVDGARWIARAASSITLEDPGLRTTFLGHAMDEHRDYTLLEKDFVACGGKLEDIRSTRKNIGSEALSAWMFHRAGHENPLDLLGAMFVIEGLGNRLAGRWARMIRDQLSLEDDQIRFLNYHADADERHLERFWQAIDSTVTDAAAADAIVRTAEVTARLYRLQLEEIAEVS